MSTGLAGQTTPLRGLSCPVVLSVRAESSDGTLNDLKGNEHDPDSGLLCAKHMRIRHHQTRVRSSGPRPPRATAYADRTFCRRRSAPSWTHWTNERTACSYVR